MIKEACVESFEKALEAQNHGANRIELCENLAVGGTTPSYGTVKVCLEKLNIPIFPMIRARGGNFIYSKDEIEIMKEDIKLALESLGYANADVSKWIKDEELADINNIGDAIKTILQKIQNKK